MTPYIAASYERHGWMPLYAAPQAQRPDAQQPQLLEVLKACHLELRDCSRQMESAGLEVDPTVVQVLEAASAAIAKAEGGAA